MAKRSCSTTTKSPPSDHHHHHSDHYSDHYSDHFNIDNLLSSLLSLSDLPAITTSFDRIVNSTSSDADRRTWITRAVNLGAVLIEAGNRVERRCSENHNALVWPLSPDLTVKKLDLRILCSSGGMPSALSTSVAICHDSLFPVSLGFTLIVMYDVIGVRRHAGMQAQVLNLIIEDLFQGHPISKQKLKELLGHTPSEVFAGAVLGILVACFCCRPYCFAAT